MTRRPGLFQVALKALVTQGDRLLVLREATPPGLWELPGGRIDAGEEGEPHRDVLRRELREELGEAFRCEIGAPFLTWMRSPRRPDAATVFVVGFACAGAEGEIQLSDEHGEYRWIDRAAMRGLNWAPGYADALAEWWARATPP